MEPQNFIEQLGKKGDNAGYLAKVVSERPSLIPIVLERIGANESSTKFKSLKVLAIISAENPVILYPYFDSFAKLLDCTNNILKWNAIDIVANLTAVDAGDKFGPLFIKFYGLLEEGSLITSAHIVESSAIIIKNKPALETGITRALLGVETISLPTEECRNILRGKVILTFGKYAGISKNREEMIHFAKRQIDNPRPATRKKAGQFIRKHSSPDG